MTNVHSYDIGIDTIIQCIPLLYSFVTVTAVNITDFLMPVGMIYTRAKIPAPVD